MEMGNLKWKQTNKKAGETASPPQVQSEVAREDLRP